MVGLLQSDMTGLPKRLQNARRRFSREETGSLSVFSIFMFFIIISVSGIGIDLMLNELRRVKLQAALDHAIVAAADMDQDLAPEDVVNDYFAKVGYSDYLTGVAVDQGPTHKIVTASARQTAPTLLTRLLGVEELTAPAFGTAEEEFTRVEISMVLDISGSMADNNKMTNLQDAATEFVDLVLHPSFGDKVSLSLIPYSEQVNVGPHLMAQFNTSHVHNYSHCIEFPDAAYTSTALDTSLTYQQTQHFQWNWGAGYAENAYAAPICPQQDFERVTPISKNADYLKAQINALEPRGGTQIFVGMKWATALLNPAFNATQVNMVAQGYADPDFADRPLVDDETVEKHIILMTDGKNSWSNRIQNWAIDTQDEVELWATYNFQWSLFRVGYNGNNTGGIAPQPDARHTRDPFDPTNTGGVYGLDDQAGTGATAPNASRFGLGPLGFWQRVLAGLTLPRGAGMLAGRWTFPEVFEGGPENFDFNFDGTVLSGYSWSSFFYQKYTAATGDSLLASLCTAAKTDGIIVWTVGFEVDQHGADVMEACASSPSHFFRVENTEISTAFRQIASKISQLRLTQ